MKKTYLLFFFITRFFCYANADTSLEFRFDNLIYEASFGRNLDFAQQELNNYKFENFVQNKDKVIVLFNLLFKNDRGFSEALNLIELGMKENLASIRNWSLKLAKSIIDINKKDIVNNNLNKLINTALYAIKDHSLIVKEHGFELFETLISGYKKHILFTNNSLQQVLDIIQRDYDSYDWIVKQRAFCLLKKMIEQVLCLDQIIPIAEIYSRDFDVKRRENALDLFRYLARYNKGLDKAFIIVQENYLNEAGCVRGSALHLFEVLVKRGIGLQEGLVAACKTFFRQNGWHYRNRALDLFCALFDKNFGFAEALELIEVGIVSDFGHDSFNRSIRLLKALIKYNVNFIIKSEQRLNKVLEIISIMMNSQDSYFVKNSIEILAEFIPLRHKAFEIPQDIIDKAVVVAETWSNSIDNNHKINGEIALKALIKAKKTKRKNKHWYNRIF